MNECIFCKIVKGEVPAAKIYDDHDVMAFLDINPATPGHALVIPKKHSTNIMDTDERTFEKVMCVVKVVSERVKSRLNADGINVLQNNGRQSGQLVDHLHVHIIPRYTNDNFVLRFPRASVSQEDMKKIQEKLSETEKPAKGSDWV
jgi:histidine triad (HIT) family protein